MSTYLNIDEIATSITGLEIPGVTVKDTNELPDIVHDRECPLLTPAPNYLSNVIVERVSYGSPTQARKTITYQLTYRLFYAQVGSKRGLRDIYNGLVACLDNVISEFVDNDVIDGLIDITPTGANAPGLVSDPAGNQFHGTDINLLVTVFVR